jgi:hypothetical protein
MLRMLSYRSVGPDRLSRLLFIFFCVSVAAPYALYFHVCIQNECHDNNAIRPTLYELSIKYLY